MARLILNGKAARRFALRSAISACRKEGFSLDVRITHSADDAARYAEEAGADGIERVIAGGGDGTVHQVVNGLMKIPPRRRPALGILPLGTANDLARSLGLPMSSYRALVVAMTMAARPIDVPSMNDRFFINMATGGFGAEITSSTPKSLKRLLGGGAYSLIGAMRAWQYRPYPGRLQWDGGEHEGSLFVLAMGNGISAGGGLRLTPDAKLDDGLLDVLAVRDVASLRDMWGMRRELQSRPHKGTFVETFRSAWLSFESDETMPLTLDGEPCWKDGFQVKVNPLALSLVAPAHCPLIASRHGRGGAAARADAG